jgi:chemotaxis-related protein WspD
MIPESVRVDDCWNRIGVQGDHSCPELERHVHCRNCPVYSAAALTLLDRDPPPGYLTEWAERYAHVRGQDETGILSVLIFRIGAEWLALPTALVDEVAEERPLHSLPHRRDRLVRGIVNVRGELVVCVALDELLGMGGGSLAAHHGTGAFRRLLVVSREGSRLAFAADEVSGTERFHPRELRAVPATMAQATSTYTRDVLPWRQKAVGRLDDRLLFDSLNRGLA